MKVFYDPKQSVAQNNSHSPSAGKPALAIESWKKLNIPLEIESYTPLTREGIYMAHSKEYVDGVLDCKIPNGFGNKSLEVAKALPWVTGCAVASAVYSWKNNKPSFAPISGSHHSFHGHGGAFCTFNYEIITALICKLSGAQKIGIIDTDAHFSDGTLSLIKHHGLEAFIQHYSLGRENLSKKDAKDWLRRLPEIVFSFEGCDLVMFYSGADAHADDMGGIFTTEQLRERDYLIFSTLNRLSVPVSTTLGGGYRRDKGGSIRPVLEIHDNTMLEAHAIYETI